MSTFLFLVGLLLCAQHVFCDELTSEEVEAAKAIFCVDIDGTLGIIEECSEGTDHEEFIDMSQTCYGDVDIKDKKKYMQWFCDKETDEILKISNCAEKEIDKHGKTPEYEAAKEKMEKCIEEKFTAD